MQSDLDFRVQARRKQQQAINLDRFISIYSMYMYMIRITYVHSILYICHSD